MGGKFKFISVPDIFITLFRNQTHIIPKQGRVLLMDSIGLWHQYLMQSIEWMALANCFSNHEVEANPKPQKC